jgi:hypothetical protein
MRLGEAAVVRLQPVTTGMGANSRSADANVERGLVVPDRLQLPLLDPQVAREFGNATTVAGL